MTIETLHLFSRNLLLLHLIAHNTTTLRRTALSTTVRQYNILNIFRSQSTVFSSSQNSLAKTLNPTWEDVGKSPSFTKLYFISSLYTSQNLGRRRRSYFVFVLSVTQYAAVWSYTIVDILSITGNTNVIIPKCRWYIIHSTALCRKWCIMSILNPRLWVGFPSLSFEWRRVDVKK